eukprot:5990383-Amphidinium_carterae.1
MQAEEGCSYKQQFYIQQQRQHLPEKRGHELERLKRLQNVVMKCCSRLKRMPGGQESMVDDKNRLTAAAAGPSVVQAMTLLVASSSRALFVGAVFDYYVLAWLSSKLDGAWDGGGQTALPPRLERGDVAMALSA